jgi:Fur family transcriptional regulator, ferric uptake regulator
MANKLKTRRAARAREQLNSVGLKATPQRLKVLHLLESHERRHLTAEEIYRRISEESGHVALATVYRVLGQLTDAGILARHIFSADSGKAVYELRRDTHHDHLICVQCSRVDEFVDETLEERSRGVAAAKGYELVQHHLTVHGYCAACHAAVNKASA